jgi:hypothetical protein
MTTRSRFQRAHRPTRVLAVKCTSRRPRVGGCCPDCNRYLERTVDHIPNQPGQLGWIEYYADGTTYTVPAGDDVKEP